MNQAASLGLTALVASLLGLSACGGKVVVEGAGGGSSSASASSTAAGEGGSQPETCEDIKGTMCPAGQYCEQYGTCLVKPSGACLDKPTSCTGTKMKPVCGCDGVFYLGDCAAHAAGVPASSSDTSCMFACGNFSCERGAAYCRLTNDGQTIQADCIPLPAGCADCSCVDPCSSCSQSTEGDVTVTCESF